MVITFIGLIAALVLMTVCTAKVHGASNMTKVYKRIVKCKKAVGKTWDQIAQEAGIPVASWMTGINTSSPTDVELEKMAPVLNTTYEYLKYGKE